MEETIRDDGFEVTFVVEVPRAEAWDRLANAKPAFEGLGSAREGQWWIPGVEAPADELEVREKELLRARKAMEPCKGTEIVITMTDEDTGTRIRFVQTGFGPRFGEARPWLAAGWYPILADLVVFFERGVSLGRHAGIWAGIGCDVAETGGGLVALDVAPDGFAAQAGIQRGDLIVQLAGSPITTVRDLAVLVRGPLRQLGTAKVRYLRGDQLQSGSGAIA